MPSSTLCIDILLKAIYGSILVKNSSQKVINRKRASRLCRVQSLLKNAFREQSLMSLPLHHQRKLKQHWKMLRNLGNGYLEKLGRYSQQKLYLSDCKMKPKKELHRNKPKQRRSESYSWKKQKSIQRTSEMMMLVMKMKALTITMEQFAPSVNVNEEVTWRKEIGYIQYLWRIYLPSMHAKRYWS